MESSDKQSESIERKSFVQSEFFFLPPQHHIFVIDWST